jgi:hypothetical protein
MVPPADTGRHFRLQNIYIIVQILRLLLPRWCIVTPTGGCNNNIQYYYHSALHPVRRGEPVCCAPGASEHSFASARSTTLAVVQGVANQIMAHSSAFTLSSVLATLLPMVEDYHLSNRITRSRPGPVNHIGERPNNEPIRFSTRFFGGFEHPDGK